ncbi:HAMP domain-containing sensor histidine kinase [Luteococcus sp. H138]|uniref:HAMP domain-containing sensor histidine kinase n=1 Tax=unclassified Luteococcus TaxID=2639923 RepID=UPI00313DBB0B
MSGRGVERRARWRRPAWLRLPGLRTQIALAVWGAVLVTNGMASDLAISSVDSANHQAAYRAQAAALAGQTSSWLANRDATAAEFGRTRAQAAGAVRVWQLPANRVRTDGLGDWAVEVPESATWQSGEVPYESVYPLGSEGSGASKRWVGYLSNDTAMQVFPRGDGTVLAVVETVDSGVDWSAQHKLKRDLDRQGWALGLLSGVGAWLLSGALMRPARRASEVARRLGRGELSARVPVTGRDEIAVLGSSINDMASSLQQMMAAQRHFISDTAHELRTPTAALLATASALDEPSTRDEAAALVSPQLRRLSTLTEDLLALSRFDDGREARDDQVVDLVDVAEHAARQVAAGQDVRIRSEGPVFAIVDPARISTIVRNLVSNGLRHGEAPVVVVVSEAGDQGVIRVSDAGPGVPAEQREVIFNRFVRGDDARHGEGAGLGLAIARENAELHGGSLELGEDGHGFTLRLPLSPLATAPERAVERVRRISTTVTRPPAHGITVPDVLTGLFWNGAAMFTMHRALMFLVWGETSNAGLLLGSSMALVLAGRWLAARNGSTHPWRWGFTALAPLLVVLVFGLGNLPAALAVTLGSLLWMITQRRR